MSAPERVLVVRLSSIGDVVHALPAFQELRRVWPEARIGWAVEPAAEGLVGMLDVDLHCVPTPDLKRRPLSPAPWKRLLALRRELRESRYDLVLDLQGLAKSAIVGRLAGAPVVGYDRDDARESIASRLYRRRAPRLPEGLHAVERARRLVAFATGVEPGPVGYPDLVDPRASRSVRGELERKGIREYLLLHTAANWSSKRYPDEHWVGVARGLHEATGLPTLWLWGPGERDRAERLAGEAGAGNAASFATTLPQLAALIAGARLLVGGDSAPLHLAVACGTPVVGLFGPTDPEILGPLDPADGVVRKLLPCSHCHRRVCPLGTRECLETLPPESLVRAAAARLGVDAAR